MFRNIATRGTAHTCLTVPSPCSFKLRSPNVPKGCSQTRRCTITGSGSAYVATSLPASDSDARSNVRTERSPLDNTYLRGLLWNERVNLAIAVLCAVLCTCSNLAAPVISGYLFEVLAGRQPAHLYPQLLTTMAVLYVVEPLLGKVYVTKAIHAMENVLSSIRKETFRVLLMQPIGFFDKHGHTDLSNILAIELDTLRSFTFGNISRDRGLRAVLEATGSIIVLFVLSWRLAPVLATVIVCTGIAAATYRKVTRGIEARQSKALLSMTRVAGQAFQNVRTVRAFAGENLERERFNAQVDRSHKAGVLFADAKAWLEASNRGSVHLSLVMLYALGGWLVNAGLMPLRVLLTGIGYTFSLLFATQGSVNSLSDLRKASSALGRVRALLETTRAEPHVEAGTPPGEWWVRANERQRSKENGRRAAPTRAEGQKDAAVQEQYVQGSSCPYPFHPMPDDAAFELANTCDIELSNVHFSYPMRKHRDILAGLDLTLKRGTITALVGRSGAGKSTIASLLARFYTPDTGSISLGGVDIDAMSRLAWSTSLALVAQEPVLFTGTIADNISYGKPHATEAEILRAATAANAHEFIDELPLKYDTCVGERGQQLSGGQKQRIAVARALLKDAPILILDEATSSLDNVSEKLVNEAIARLVEGRTVMIIAHRLSTIQRADMIVVMEDGKVVEKGTHDDLIQRGGAYTQLVDSQGLALAL